MKIILIGASKNKEKFGNKILINLLNKGHIVIPVNPIEKEIDGIKTYKSISEIIDDFDIVNFVVKPEITLNILKDNLDLIKNKKIWCQPGSSNETIKNFLEKNGFKNYILDSCIMLNNL